eukprot:4619238-Pyramimonas_sp.AAC.1
MLQGSPKGPQDRSQFSQQSKSDPRQPKRPPRRPRGPHDGSKRWPRRGTRPLGFERPPGGPRRAPNRPPK